jgi:hypothetical protein
MRLRAKGVLIVCVATMSTSALALALAWTTVRANIAHMEEAVARKDLARAEQALMVQTSALRDAARYWGIWDDAYTFAKDRNRRFVETNLYGTVLQTSGIDVLLFLDPACRVLYGVSLLSDALDVETAEALTRARCVDGFLKVETAESGFLAIESGRLLVAIQPILTSKREGPSRGVLLVGRRVDVRMVDALRSVARLDVDLIPADQIQCKLTRAALDAGSTPPALVEPRNLISHQPLLDLESRTVLVLRVSSARDHWQHAHALLLRLSWMLGLVGAILSVAVVLLLDRSILARLATLLSAVEEVGASSDLARRVPVRGRDELSALATAINFTFATLEESDRRRRVALDELALAKSQLEARVLERTSALESSAKAHFESEQRVRQIVDLLPQLVFATDATGRLALANRALKEAFGATDAELVGRRGADLTARSEGLAAFVSPEPIGRTDSRESQVVDANGQVRLLTTTRLPLDPTSTTGLAMVGVATDITEQRRLEEALRHSQKLDGIGRLAGGIAHDFNNLLAAILSCAYMAAEGLSADDRRREEIEEIRLAAERAAELTRQLLTFARRQRAEVRAIGLSSLVEGMAKLLRRVLSEDIAFHLDIAKEGDHVDVDAGQMEQVLMNLVLNARDAMPNGGTLTIGTRRVEALELAGLAPPMPIQAPACEISVTDTGCGMEPHVQARLFEPFFSTKEVGKGTGLGLAMCYGIVRALGGHIWAESTPGRGSRFRILLPSSSGRPAGRRLSETRTAQRGAETILVVEDNDLVRGSTTRLLERQGYRVLSASDGKNALMIARAHQGQLDLVIADIVMPGLSGPEVADEITRMRPSTPVLFVTGYADDALEARTRSERRGEILRKPFTAADLAKRIREILGARESSSSTVDRIVAD